MIMRKDKNVETIDTLSTKIINIVSNNKAAINDITLLKRELNLTKKLLHKLLIEHKKLYSRTVSLNEKVITLSGTVEQVARITEKHNQFR